MKKYNLFTVANDSYAPFLDILINSVADSCEGAGDIFVADVGLDQFLPDFSNREKVKIIPTSTTDDFSGAHSAGWAEATKQKTRIFLDLLETTQSDLPIIMIDNDVCVLRDLSHLIDCDYDIQLTKRPKVVNAAGIELSEIASLAIFNNRQVAIPFLTRWIAEMETLAHQGIKLPHETPALNLLMRTGWPASSLKVGYLEEEDVCSTTGASSQAYALHFKSFGGRGSNRIENFEVRLKKVLQNFSQPRKPLEYLTPEFYQRWCSWCTSEFTDGVEK